VKVLTERLAASRRTEGRRVPITCCKYLTGALLNLYRNIETRAELEREYSPSSCVTNLGALLATYAEKSVLVRTQLQRVVRQYGTAPPEQLDFFPAPSTCVGDKPRPALVYIHGGYWQELSKDEHSFPARMLHANDISYIAINYGLAPESSMAEMIERCRRALAWIAQHCAELRIDPRSLHLAGCSAGGHLAAMTALTDWGHYGLSAAPLRSLTLLSGVFDLRPLPLTYVNDAVGMSATEALLQSPLLLLEASQAVIPPTLVVWGDNETAEFKRQSREFAEALARKGIEVHAEEIAGRNHFDLLFDLGDPNTPFGALTLERLGGTTR